MSDNESDNESDEEFIKLLLSDNNENRKRTGTDSDESVDSASHPDKKLRENEDNYSDTSEEFETDEEEDERIRQEKEEEEIFNLRVAKDSI